MTILGKINCSKIDKSRLFHGKKGVYLDIVLIETPNGKYGDFMICESVSEEERKAGKKGTIIGNAKYSKKKSDSPEPSQEEPDDDVPF